MKKLDKFNKITKIDAPEEENKTSRAVAKKKVTKGKKKATGKKKGDIKFLDDEELASEDSLHDFIADDDEEIKKEDKTKKKRGNPNWRGRAWRKR
jgi:hypothetical protein